MRSLRGNNSKENGIGNKKKKESDSKIDDDDDIGANGDDTTDDEGGIDTPPPTVQVLEEEQLEEEDPLVNNGTEKDSVDKIDVQPKKNTKSKEPQKKKKKKEPEPDYEVDQIVDMETQQRWRKCPVKFRVRWVGFTEKDDSWLPASNLNCEDAIAEFLEISGRKPEYTRALEAKKKKEDLIQENQRISSRKVYSVSYSEISDEDEILPSGTKTRKFKTPAEMKQMPLPKKNKKKKTTPKKYEVQRIIDHRVRGKYTDYKVRWKGFGPSKDTWMPETDLNCIALIKAYKLFVGLRNPLEVEEEDFEVQMIVDERIVKGKHEYRVRWRNYNAEDDSWLPEDELNCPDLLSTFKASIESGEEDYQVEKILGMRERSGKKEYLVGWKGFTSANDTWEPKQNLEGCQNILDKFMKEQSRKSIKKKEQELTTSEDEGADEVPPAPKKRKKEKRSRVVKKEPVEAPPSPPSRTRRRSAAVTSYVEEDED